MLPPWPQDKPWLLMAACQPYVYKIEHDSLCKLLGIQQKADVQFLLCIEFYQYCFELFTIFAIRQPILFA